MTSKLVLLFVILITQQTFGQKPSEANLQNALQNLANALNVIINQARNDLNKQLLDLVNFGENLVASNEDVVYGTASVNIQPIDYAIQVANRNQIDVSSCNPNQKQKIAQLAYDAADKARTCMTNKLQDGQNVVYASMSEIMKLQEVVDDLKKKAENCHDANCAKAIIKEINSTIDSLLLKSKTILNDTAKKILNVKKDIENCMKTFIEPAVFKIAGMTSDVTQCIAEILAKNGRL